MNARSNLRTRGTGAVVRAAAAPSASVSRGARGARSCHFAAAGSKRGVARQTIRDQRLAPTKAIATEETTGVTLNNEGKGKRVLVVGGDGYCGWASALHLSARG